MTAAGAPLDRPAPAAVKRLTVIILLALCGCTDRQVAQWVDWWTQDPAAAEAFANQPEIQASLADRGVSAATGGWTVDWDDIAACESGGRWDHPPVTNRYGTFSGGLMWNHRYWDANGGERYADQPWQASKAEQIAVSEDYADGSLAAIDRAWQCFP